ncbi:reverse transcriptase family protein [Streptomyces sp. DSM 42041]|uniref:RNA-directed DNA polymerase n=1 Tax=Streptomyces hazeniae TaxID=3075538 RepID=A0ABU2NT68_9ACTN|nr:reverse transcriptase family protein [Streptomyces sp. DSM 42041]MDT0379403.1 reverse transcriptase family protein [Streptomyces sp. DSM 42041]
MDEALTQIRRAEGYSVTPILTLRHLAHLTGAEYLYLRRIVQRQLDPYTVFSRPKRTPGKVRTIASPSPVLMDLQRWLLSNVFERVRPHRASYAYQPGRSAVLCAKRHLGATWLLKFDLHDFFHSVDERAVYRVLRTVGYNKLISFEIARVCTRLPGGETRAITRFKYPTIDSYPGWAPGFLPQGAPTSGAIANLAARELDDRLWEVADRYDLAYTRYADDMTFSTLRQLSRVTVNRCIADITKVVHRAHFRVHRKKTRVIPPGARKVVLGLLVDGDRLRMPVPARQRLETHVRGAATFGLTAHVEHARYSSLGGFIRHVDGLLRYAQGVDRSWAGALAERWEAVLKVEGITVLDRERW